MGQIIQTSKYNAGSEAGANWTNDANAWDDSVGTFAYRDIPKNTAKETTKWIKGTAHDNTRNSGNITKVEIGIENKVENTTNITMYAVPIFGGSTDGDEHTCTKSTSNHTDWFDITSDTNAPGTWSWSDVDNLDIKVYGANAAGFSAYMEYVNQFYVRITYESISWSTQTEECDTGQESNYGNVDWTNPSYAWDGNDSNNATVSLSDGEDAEFLSAYVSSITGSGTIARLWLGVKSTSSSTDYKGQVYLSDSISMDSPTWYVWGVVDYETVDVEQTDYIEIPCVYNRIPTWSGLSDVYVHYYANNSTGSGISLSVNQLYLKIEYTNDAVQRYDHLIEYNDGTTNASAPYDDVDWSNPTYAWDSNSSNKASVALGSGEYSYYLTASGHDNTVSTASAEIKGVSASFGHYTLNQYIYGYVYSSDDNGSSWDLITFLSPGTTQDNSFYLLRIDYTGTELYATADWTWNKINSFDFRVGGVGNVGSDTLYINQISLGIVYFLPTYVYDKTVADSFTVSDSTSASGTYIISTSDSFTLDEALDQWLSGVAVSWGEQNPDSEYGEGNEWSDWQKSTGDVPQTISGSDWGYLDTYNQTHLGPVYDTTISGGSWTFTLATDTWQTGSGAGTVYIRGSMTTFSGTDETPSWEEITTTASNKQWRYIQLKVEHTI